MNCVYTNFTTPASGFSLPAGERTVARGGWMSEGAATRLQLCTRGLQIPALTPARSGVDTR